MIDTKALRDKILELAMSGKLVSQDANDEPASVLLEKIKAEKKLLISKGKIKKAKSLQQITIENISFDIPDSWEWSRVSEVTNFGNFHSIKPKDISPNKWLVELEDIEKNTGNIRNRRITLAEKTKSNKFLFNKGDILYGKLRPYLRKIFIADLDGYCSTEIFPISVYQGMTNKLLLYWLKSKYISALIDAAVHGVNLPRISPVFFSNMVIPIPPQEEQKRIVAKIEELFELIDIIENESIAYEEITKQLERKVLDLGMRGKLVQQNSEDEPASKLLAEIRTKKKELTAEGLIKKEKELPPITEDEKTFDIPESWKWVKLGDVFQVRGGKRIPRGLQLLSEETPFKYIRVTDMKDNTVDGSKIKYMSEDIYKLIQNYFIKKEDLYITIAGTIGRVGSVPDSLDGAILTENAVKVSNIIFVERLFILIAFQSEFVQQQFLSSVNKVAQPKLSIRSIKNVIIPIAPLKEQKRIVKRIEEIFQVINS